PWISVVHADPLLLDLGLVPDTKHATSGAIPEHESSRTRDAFAYRSPLLRPRCPCRMRRTSGFLHGVSHPFAGLPSLCDDCGSLGSVDWRPCDFGDRENK